jgi:hypothetical protein
MKLSKIKIQGSKVQGTIIIAWLFILLAFSLNSCKKFLDIPQPQTKLVTASVFNNDATATSAQLTIYIQMWTNAESYLMASNMGLYSDELQNYSTQIPQVPLYTNSLTASSNLSSWSTYYNYIYEANAVINGLQTTTGTSAAVKQQLTGEAYFIRAFWHFYLTNIYGDVPLVLTTDYTTNGTIGRTPRAQVLQQVVADLKTAEGLLNVNYVDGTDTATTTERVRPNKAVAEALLARAYLYLADYGKDASNFGNAETEATAVITNSAYSLSPLSGVFLENGSEAIWQLQTPSNQSADTPDGQFFILLGAPSTGTHRSATISSQLMSSFEPNDQRKIAWIGNYTTTQAPVITYYFPYKYKNNTYQNQEYDMVLRLGEQYLIRAEARAEQNNISGALADLNMIRNRAGLSNYNGATDQASVLAAILHERQVELFTEWGHRWFDLCRTGNANSVMGVVCPQKDGTWNSNGYQLLWPIPQLDRSADANLTQNPGY